LSSVAYVVAVVVVVVVRTLRYYSIAFAYFLSREWNSPGNE